MAGKRTVNAVPEVNIEAELPEIPQGAVIWPFASPWRNGEREFVLGIMATAAVRNGSWQAVSVKTFADILRNSPFAIQQQGVINAVWALAEDSYLDVVSVEGFGDYIVPRQKFAEVLDQCTLRYALTK